MELEEACKIRRRLAEATNDEAMRTLRKLQEATVTKRLLEESKLGMEVNRLRKGASVEVAKLATLVLVKWRDIMLEKGAAAAKDEQAGGDGRPRQDSVPTAAGELMQQYMTGEPVRDKCFEMLLGALTADCPGDPDELTMSTCRAIEECLFREFGESISPQYKAKFRSRYLNLKDKQNGTLRKSLLTGVLAPARFCAMTTAELASEERRREDARLIEENLREAKAAQDTEAETEQFKCGRCKQRRTKYYQLQTRSADEPMTTFVTCINCGNRWKFC